MRVPGGRPSGGVFLIGMRLNRRNWGKQRGLAGVDDYRRAVTGRDSHGGHHLGRRHLLQGARDLLGRRTLPRRGGNPFAWRYLVTAPVRG